MVANKEKGFVLVATIWVVALILVLAAWFHAYIQRQVDLAYRMKQELQQQLDIEATSASVQYMLATRRVTLAGLIPERDRQQYELTIAETIDINAVGGELRLDGRAYSGVGTARFSIQDQAGLLSLNAESTPALLESYLKQNMPSQRARELSASLADYIDANSVKRINGAEAFDYSGRGLPEPTNWFLLTENELLRVMGWSKLLDESGGEDFRNFFAITHNNVLNLNTAPVSLLAFTLGLKPDEASMLAQAREEYPFRSLKGVAEVLGRLDKWNPERFRFYPDRRLKVKIDCQDCNYQLIQSVYLTPNGVYGPWQTDYHYIAQVNDGYSEDETLVLAGPALFADPLPAEG